MEYRKEKIERGGEKVETSAIEVRSATKIFRGDINEVLSGGNFARAFIFLYTAVRGALHQRDILNNERQFIQEPVVELSAFIIFTTLCLLIAKDLDKEEIKKKEKIPKDE